MHRPRTRFEVLAPAQHALPDGLAARTLTPALVVFLEHVRTNVQRVLAHTGGPDRWRPHLKTTKTPALWVELVRAGVRHFKCATTREARLLLQLLREEGVADGDLCVAYPLVGPALEVLGRLATEYPETRLSVLSEDPALVAAVPAPVSIFVDVNPGMHRTGIPLERAADVHAVARAAGERFRGLHYYEGHLHAGGPDQRRAAVHACLDRLLVLRAALVADGLSPRELITSGTPAFLHALEHPGLKALTGAVHRVSPGTVVLHDLRSEQENPDLDLLPAACVLTRVVSRPGPDRVTCDAGSKALAAEAGDPAAFVLGAPGLLAESPSEEHLPLRVTAGDAPAPGDLLLLVPRHVCPTVNLAEEALLVERGAARVVPVLGRAHDLVV